MPDDTSPRGDAAYRAQKDAINQRNEAARKAGRAHRQAEDQKAQKKRAQSDADDIAGLRDTFGGNSAR